MVRNSCLGHWKINGLTKGRRRGLLIEGQWLEQGYNNPQKKGKFTRDQSSFRHTISAHSSEGFVAEPGRYHLYVSLACPWAHRTLIFRKLKQLEEIVSVSVVSPDMLENGWQFETGRGFTDSLYGMQYFYQIYQKADSHYIRGG